MSLIEDILKDLECPVCYELPSARVYQCRGRIQRLSLLEEYWFVINIVMRVFDVL